jgi:hypothetical protein
MSLLVRAGDVYAVSGTNGTCAVSIEGEGQPKLLQGSTKIEVLKGLLAIEEMLVGR